MSWGDVPTWVAAIGTVGTLGVALRQIGNERSRRLKDDKQLRAERHVEQARHIAAYVGEEETPGRGPTASSMERGRTAVYLVNNSPEPVYSVVVGLVFVQGAAPRSLEAMLEFNHDQHERRGPITTANILPGGLYRVWIAGTGWGHILSGRLGVDIAFSDATGAHWVRRANGRLEELPSPPLEYLQQWHFYGPHDLQVPARVLAAK